VPPVSDTATALPVFPTQVSGQTDLISKSHHCAARGGGVVNAAKCYNCHDQENRFTKQSAFQLDLRYISLQYQPAQALFIPPNQQSTAPLENHHLPLLPVENLGNSVEKVELPCGNDGESVGKS